MHYNLSAFKVRIVFAAVVGTSCQPVINEIWTDHGSSIMETSSTKKPPCVALQHTGHWVPYDAKVYPTISANIAGGLDPHCASKMTRRRAPNTKNVYMMTRNPCESVVSACNFRHIPRFNLRCMLVKEVWSFIQMLPVCIRTSHLRGVPLQMATTLCLPVEACRTMKVG